MNYNEQQLDELFEELNTPRRSSVEVEEYTPLTEDSLKFTPPVYIPTPKTAGPQPLTIEEYLRRNKKTSATQISKTPVKTRRPRAGKAVKERQRKAELHRIIAITIDKTLKNKLICELQKWDSRSQRK